jgi:hypothetical protein
VASEVIAYRRNRLWNRTAALGVEQTETSILDRVGVSDGACGIDAAGALGGGGQDRRIGRCRRGRGRHGGGRALRCAAWELKRAYMGAPISLAGHLEVHGGVPECTVVDRIYLHGAVIAPATDSRIVLGAGAREERALALRKLT